ncbi:MAG: 5-deoxy-glucuronate isomerase [Pseudomonadota bacterium]
MVNLLRRPQTGSCVHHITPENVRGDCTSWSYVGFELYKLAQGERLTQKTGDREHLLVIVTGRLSATAGGQDQGTLGGRMNIFERQKAWALYVPNGSDWEVVAETDAELAICTAPGHGGHGGHDIRVIAPDDAPMEARGTGANTRFVNAICMEERDWADSLLVTEVWTPNGNWSSYPSHKHDTDAYPDETYLEETYYHRIDPPTGFGIQRVYNDSRSLDETMAISDGDLVLVPEGYHPCAALYGHDLYYLNVMAGPRRAWRFRNDPDHDWVFQRDSKS